MKRVAVSLAWAGLLACSGSALAQNLDFGAWCATVARHSADRCLEARPEDKTAYEAYLGDPLLFNKEVNRRDEASRLETERVNRMGDVTPDYDPTRDAPAGR